MKKKQIIKIKAKKSYKISDFEIHNIYSKSNFILLNKNYKKKAKNNDFICSKYKNSVSEVLFNETGINSIHSHVTLSELNEMINKLNKDVKKFKKLDKKRIKNDLSKLNICFRHLSPDLTFVVDYNK